MNCVASREEENDAIYLSVVVCEISSTVRCRMVDETWQGGAFFERERLMICT